ncbi:MAG: dimethyl sulfoxide reductase anchor subunit [bacterium]|nr:dimethyl sulfoxide reductase anchor subunit [bacterium]
MKCFYFDLNRCTGCGACVVACRTEKAEAGDINFRRIHTFNEQHHPGLPYYCLSLACNHCEEPACKKHCPALAYSKDPVTGAVVHHAGKCMGCKYCTWACPFDAPLYETSKGIVAKCDFCIQRQEEGEAPACVCACPVNALRLEDSEPPKENQSLLGDLNNPVTPGLEGFKNSTLKPSLEIKELRPGGQVPLSTAPASKGVVETLFESCLKVPLSRITLRAEWTLMVFTTIAYILVARQTGFVFGDMPPVPYISLGLAAVAMGFAMVHLGRKSRAYRAVFNLKGSWLSREILLFSLFLGVSMLYIYFPYDRVFGVVSVVMGFAGLFAVDRIYQVAVQAGPFNFHSAHVFLNGFFLAGVFLRSVPIVVVSCVVILFFYVSRKIYFKRKGKRVRVVVSVVRVVLGFVVPLVLVAFLNEDYYPWLLAGVVVGELVDRMEYYAELEIETPEGQMLNKIKGLIG